MKKRIISFLLALLMLIGSLPLTVLAAEIEAGVGAKSGTQGTGQGQSSKPVLNVSSDYFYRNPQRPDDYRVLPNANGEFVFSIYLDGIPGDGSDVTVYYRTIDDTAVSEWGDYESVGAIEEASVTLSQTNGYRATVTVKSVILPNAFLTPDMSGENFDPQSIFSRRFAFEIIRTEGAAVDIIDPDSKEKIDTSVLPVSKRCNFYCYLLAVAYYNQTNNGSIDNSGYTSSAEYNFGLIMDYIDEMVELYPGSAEALFIKEILTQIWTGVSSEVYPSLYTSLGQGALINTSKMNVGATASALNLSFDETWRNYLSSGWCDIGISMAGILARESKSGHGPVTFNLYYTYQGVRKLALTLRLQGKFDKETEFGWQNAFLYAIDGVESDGGEKFIEDNFVGFTVYDNDGNVAYEVNMDEDRSDSEIVRVSNDLNRLVTQGKVVFMHGNTDPKFTIDDYINENPDAAIGVEDLWSGFSQYYLRLPSNFAFADKYSYSITSDSTNSGEVRWVEDTNLAFTLLGKGLGQPAIQTIEGDKQMVTSNVDQLKEGDPLRVMIRFDQPVHVSDPDNCYITLDVNGTFPVKLKFKPTGYMASATERHYYAMDTLVFEGSLEGFSADKIESLRNMVLDDGVKKGSAGICGYFTGRNMMGKKLVDLYGYDKDMRAAEVTVSTENTAGSWSKSKSLDVYLKTEGTNDRFVDYATVYYLWSSNPSLEGNIAYDSSLVFNTAVDGEISKTIIGTGNGHTYLYVKTVSSFGKTTYNKFGPYWFDNTPPELAQGEFDIDRGVREHTVTVKSVPTDMAGLGTMSLYYVPNDSEDGKGVLLKKFTLSDFSGEPQTLSHTITYEAVGMTLDDGWSEFDFYWILTDTLGNASEPSARFSLAFDTQDYLTVGNFAPSGDFSGLTEKLDDFSYIYDYTKAESHTTTSTNGDVYYSFVMELDIADFISGGGIDEGEYSVIITRKGATLVEMGCKCLSSDKDDCECARAELTSCDHSCTCDDCNLADYDYSVESAVDYSTNKMTFTVNIHDAMESGQYKIYLTRTQNKNVRTSQLFSVYATNLQTDQTTSKEKVDSGTLLINTVYQLSASDPYYYYKDKEGVIQKVNYNGEKQPATFSGSAKAKEYALFCEYADIYLYEIPSFAIADALNSGAPGYLKAEGETVVAEAGQYWIRYKSKTWTPTSGDNAWVHYYYGSDKLSKESLSANVLEALNTVASRIVGYGQSVTLTDNSLFLGTAVGDKRLDSHGMPYLLEKQTHHLDEYSTATMCGNVWTIPIAYAKDSNIYRSVFEFGVDSNGNPKEYPIVGNFLLSDSSIYQYLTYADYEKLKNPVTSRGVEWNDLIRAKGQNFVDALPGSGIYYIREMSDAGVCVYPICIDKEAPEITFEVKTGTNGDLKELTLNGKDQLKISAMQLYVSKIGSSEYDSLAYVAIYKMSNLSLVKVYTAQDLKRGSMKVDDGKYYIVVADRSGNSYTITADINVSALECEVKKSENSYIKLICNRTASQIMVYEVYRDGNLVTSTYASENIFREAGKYSIYIRDIYGNEYTNNEEEFVRNYPHPEWRYYGTDGKYHTYNYDDESGKDPEVDGTSGFSMLKLSDGNYKISTAVMTRVVISDGYQAEFVGTEPKHTVGSGAEYTITIEAGQSFTLKVYYKNHPECYTIFNGVVDVTPPAISVVADEDLVGNGEDGMIDAWLAAGKIEFNKLYLVLNGIGRTNVINGGTVNSDIIKISANDENQLYSLEVYLDGTLIKRQDRTTDFSQIIVNRWGDYRIVAKDTLGNVSEFTFTNGMPDVLDYYIDGEKKELELHSTDYFNKDHVYTKVDYGKSDFVLDVKKNADLFMSMGLSGGEEKIYGFRITDGKIYSLTYQIIDGTEIDLVAGTALFDTAREGFKAGKEYLILEDGLHKIFASVNEDMTVRFKVYASEDATKILSLDARVQFLGSNSFFVSAEISKKSSSVSFDDLGLQSGSDLRANDGFTVDESFFEAERIESVSLYYSKLNNLDKDSVTERDNIYVSGQKYTEEGFYLLVARNRFGVEKSYRISISRSFGITSSVVFSDGYKIYYSKDHRDSILYSNHQIILDLIEEDVTVSVTRNGEFYDDMERVSKDGITYLVFSEEGSYNVTLTDSYGNPLTRQLEINKSSYSVADALLVGFNEKALKKDEGYTNQKLSIDKTVFDSEGIYYLAIRYGETETVLFDAFAEQPISTDTDKLADVIGNMGDGVYTVVCRNRYGAKVNKEIHYRATPTLKLERTTRSNATPEIYDLNYALSLGFWSNNTLIFSTEANTYVFTVNGNVTECPRTLVFENAGDYGSFEYDITYIDEYGFEYSFKAYLLRKNITIDLPESITGIEIDGVLNTKSDIYVTFGENTYATYTRNNGEEVIYHSGELLKKDGTYRFTVIDYAGNASTLTVKKDTAVEYAFEVSETGAIIQNGGVVNSSKIGFSALNKDSAYIEKVLKNGVLQTDFTGSKFTDDGKWEIILADKLGNKAYFCFYIVTKAQNGFEYTTPYEYSISEMWYDSGDGVKVSYMSFVTHTDSTSYFKFTENGKYTVVMSSEVTGITSTFEFTVNTTAPDVQLVGCEVGETTINDVSITGCKVGDRIKIYVQTDTGEKLVEEVEVTMSSTKMPTITEGGKYRIVVESEAGVATELTFVRKHVMNTAGSVFIMVVIGLSVVGLFTGLIYRNKSKTDD